MTEFFLRVLMRSSVCNLGGDDNELCSQRHVLPSRMTIGIGGNLALVSKGRS